MSPIWWTKLSRTDQLKYLKAHPRSKLKPKRAPAGKGKKGAKKVVRRKKTGEGKVDPQSIKFATKDELKSLGENNSDVKDDKSAKLLTEKEVRTKGAESIDNFAKEAEAKYIPVRAELRPKEKKAALEAVSKNQKEVRNLISAKLDEQKRKVADDIDKLEPKELSKIGMLIKRGVEKESGKDLLTAAGIFLGKASLVVVGLGIATSLGVAPSLYMLGLFNFRNAINNFVDAPLRNTVTDFVTGMYEGMQETLNDFTGVKDNLVANEPDTVLSDDADNDAVESASAPTHISDGMKSLALLCKKDYYASFEACNRNRLAWMQANSLLALLYQVEFDIRKINNLYTTFRIKSNTAQIGKCITRVRELNVIKEDIQKQLGMIAATQPVDQTKSIALQFASALFGKSRGRSAGQLERTYLLDKGQLTLCWLIKAENVSASGLALIPRVYVYIACDQPLRVAIAMNNVTTPNSMQKYDIKARPNIVLSEYGLQV